jgi:hypothetical protein
MVEQLYSSSAEFDLSVCALTPIGHSIVHNCSAAVSFNSLLCLLHPTSVLGSDSDQSASPLQEHAAGRSEYRHSPAHHYRNQWAFAFRYHLFLGPPPTRPRPFQLSVPVSILLVLEAGDSQDGLHPDGTVMHHHEVHKFHKDGQPTRGLFLPRVHRWSLGPWEGHIVAFVLGAVLVLRGVDSMLYS